MRLLLLGVAMALTMTGSPGEAVSARPASIPADILNGVRVEDPFRWLEDWSDPGVQLWSDERTAEARALLDGLDEVAAMRARLSDILLHEEARHYLSVRSVGGRLFALRREPGADQAELVVLETLADHGPAKVLLNPGANGKGSNSQTIDWFVPSPDGRRVAVSVSEGGRERGALNIIDADTGQLVERPIPNVYNATAGGDVAWTSDGAALFYTRYPRLGERPGSELAFHQQVYLHRIGDPQSRDRYELGREFDRTAEIRLDTQSSTGRLLATVQDGDGGRFAVHLRQADGSWHRIAGLDDGIFQATFGGGDDVFLLTYAGASRGRILRLSALKPSLAAAQEIVPESSDAALVPSFYSHGSPTFVWSGSRLYVVYQSGGPSLLRAFDRDGKAKQAPPVPPVSSVAGLAAAEGGGVFYSVESYRSDTSWHLQEDAAESREILQQPRAPAQWSDVEVRRETAVSPDGTRVPLTILRRLGAPRHDARAVVTGYGGFSTSLQPQFTPAWRALLDENVTIVVANIRGGGEYGQAWHNDAILTRRQRAFDDFAAVLRYLQQKGYTSPAKTGIIGASNGGLLMGVTLTQHPELVGAVVAEVGLYDMVRAERDPNGVFNIPEYGTTGDPGQFAALLAYSPYHHVVERTNYPAVLFTTGANDARVNPMHSRKMAARLRAASASGRPILLRANRDTGHGAGTPLRVEVEELADAYGFLLSQLR